MNIFKKIIYTTSAIALSLFLIGCNDKSEQKIEEALTLANCPFVFDFPDSLNHKITEQGEGLSAGQKQRLMLARALLRQPDLLVLDEPMQGLDIQSEAELYDYVRSLPDRYGCSILIVSHDLQWVMQGTQRVICLNKHICCSGLPDSVQNHPEYQAIFGTNRAFYQHHHDHCGHGDSATPCQHDPRPHIHPEPEA